MTNVIVFRPEQPKSSAIQAGEAARILFFTGIRYVRDAEPGVAFPTLVVQPDTTADAGASDASDHGSGDRRLA